MTNAKLFAAAQFEENFQFFMGRCCHCCQSEGVCVDCSIVAGLILALAEAFQSSRIDGFGQGFPVFAKRTFLLQNVVVDADGRVEEGQHLARLGRPVRFQFAEFQRRLEPLNGLVVETFVERVFADEQAIASCSSFQKRLSGECAVNRIQSTHTIQSSSARVNVVRHLEVSAGQLADIQSVSGLKLSQRERGSRKIFIRRKM